MRRGIVGALLIVAAAAAQAGDQPIPDWSVDYTKSTDRAKARAGELRYGEARQTMERYLERHGRNLERRGKSRDDILARSKAESARDAVKRYRELERLWAEAQQDPAASSGAFCRALMTGAPDGFSPSPEERRAALEFAREHDEAVKQRIAQAFPMRIKLRWLDRKKHGEYERRLLDALETSARDAGLPVVRKGGKWTLEQELRFHAGKRAGGADDPVLRDSGLTIHRLSGNARLLDGRGKLKVSWLGEGKGRTFSDQTKARYLAAKDLARKTLDRLVQFALTGK